MRKLRAVEPVEYFLVAEGYENRRMELAIEKNVIAPRSGVLLSGETALILEPNPQMVKHIMESSVSSPPVLAFFSMQKAYLYLTQFPGANIAQLDLETGTLFHLQLSGGKKGYQSYKPRYTGKPFRKILGFYWEGDTEKLINALPRLMYFLKSDGQLWMDLPNVAAENRKWREAMLRQCRLQSVMLHPSYQKDAEKSVLKKYVGLLFRPKAEGTAHPYTVEIRKLACVDEDRERLAQYPRVLRLGIADLLEQNKSLNWFWSHAHELEAEVKKRKARCYAYSPEIRLWYSWLPNSNAGTYYYSASPTEKWTGRSGTSTGAVCIREP